MDASRIFKLAVVMAVAVALAGAVTTEAEEITSSTTTGVEATTVQTTPPPPRNCATARKVAGVCAARQDCDYSTGPIDRSLYAPSWYKSSCLDGEVCCPFFALVTEQPRVEQNEDESAFSDDITPY